MPLDTLLGSLIVDRNRSTSGSGLTPPPLRGETVFIAKTPIKSEVINNRDCAQANVHYCYDCDDDDDDDSDDDDDYSCN